MSVSFTDESEECMSERGYKIEQSELGRVYYPSEGITMVGGIEVNYMEYPWITCFEVEGIKILKEKRESL